jgi:hypothetical protein
VGEWFGWARVMSALYPHMATMMAALAAIDIACQAARRPVRGCAPNLAADGCEGPPCPATSQHEKFASIFGPSLVWEKGSVKASQAARSRLRLAWVERSWTGICRSA